MWQATRGAGGFGKKALCAKSPGKSWPPRPRRRWPPAPAAQAGPGQATAENGSPIRPPGLLSVPWAGLAASGRAGGSTFPGRQKARRSSGGTARRRRAAGSVKTRRQVLGGPVSPGAGWWRTGHDTRASGGNSPAEPVAKRPAAPSPFLRVRPATKRGGAQDWPAGVFPSTPAGPCPEVNRSWPRAFAAVRGQAAPAGIGAAGPTARDRAGVAPAGRGRQGHTRGHGQGASMARPWRCDGQVGQGFVTKGCRRVLRPRRNRPRPRPRRRRQGPVQAEQRRAPPVGSARPEGP